MDRRSFLQAGLALGLGPTGGFALADSLDFRVPPEESAHEMTLMQWPNSAAVYDDLEFLGFVQATIADIANTIAGFEPVVMLAAADHHSGLRKILSGAVPACGTCRPKTFGRVTAARLW